MLNRVGAVELGLWGRNFLKGGKGSWQLSSAHFWGVPLRQSCQRRFHMDYSGAPTAALVRNVCVEQLGRGS